MRPESPAKQSIKKKEEENEENAQIHCKGVRL